MSKTTPAAGKRGLRLASADLVALLDVLVAPVSSS